MRKKRQKASEEYISCYKNIQSNQHEADEPDYKQDLMVRVKRKVVNADPRMKRDYIDELNIPEKFRTHEVKTLMSNKTNYSYSMLLSTVYSKELTGRCLD